MATYQRPLQPWDPVNQDQQIKPPIRYVRDNFQGTGQDSHTSPPAQDPAMWQALTNVQPITRGVIERRWGYTALAAGVATATNRLYSFQRDSDGLRTILSVGPGAASAYYENGNSYASSFFTPNTSVPFVRSLTSRSYQYFFDGQQGDLQKWNGNPSGGMSNWGIDSTNVTANVSGGGTGTLSYGPNLAGSATNVHVTGSNWDNPTNIESDTGTFADSEIGSFNPITHVNTPSSSDYLQGKTFGFSGMTGSIVGIKVQAKLAVSSTPIQFSAQLLKAGSSYGSLKSVTATSASLTNFTYGGSSDLWGGSWALGDINSAANFGVQFQANGIGFAKISAVKITIYTTGTTGGGTSSGNGVTIVSTAGGGNINLAIGRTYYLTFYNANTGDFSDLTPASASTGALTSSKVNLELCTANDPQVTHKYLLATADGNDPSILYQVAELVNGGGGDVTSYQDNTPDTTLVNNQVLLFTDQTGTEFGVALNDPPPNGTVCIKHQGRLWMANGQNIFFSKSVAELTLPNGFIAGKYEECWPGSNYFDISQGAETVSGLLSDGQTLYIGTQLHVRRVTGNNPFNFSLPEIVHPNVGVINQETWQLVYTQGSPAGAIWLTPDFRVMQSDFNTYQDIGTKIQDILNNLQSTASTLAHGMFVADGEYDLYVLAVPYQQSTYCDTHLVYDLRHGVWFVWQPAAGSDSLLYNVTAAGQSQWLFLGSLVSDLFQYTPTVTTDNGTGFTVTAQTSWLSLTEPAHRKLLNEVEVSADSAMTTTIEGALTAGDFLSPKLIISNRASTLGPLGTLKFFVAAVGSDRYKHYRFTFKSSSTATPIMLNSYNIEVVPVSDL